MPTNGNAGCYVAMACSAVCLAPVRIALVHQACNFFGHALVEAPHPFSVDGTLKDAMDEMLQDESDGSTLIRWILLTDCPLIQGKTNGYVFTSPSTDPRLDACDFLIRAAET